MNMHDIITILVDDYHKIKQPVLQEYLKKVDEYVDTSQKYNPEKYMKFIGSPAAKVAMDQCFADDLLYRKEFDKLTERFNEELLKYLEIQNHPKGKMVLDLATRYHDCDCCGGNGDQYHFNAITDAAEAIVKLIK